MREQSLYFAALTPGESLELLLGAAACLLRGNRGYAREAAHLERRFAEHFSGVDAVAFPSARVGTASVLEALGIGEGDEVLVTGYTCAAVPLAVLSVGAVPRYVDVDLRSFAMDPNKATACLSPRTKAILLQHTLGIAGPIEEIEILAQSHGLAVIEDAALAVGSGTGRRRLGTAGVASVFSFELSKTLSAGWGGMVVCRSSSLAKRLRSLRSKHPRMSRVWAARRLAQSGASGLLYRPEVYALTKYVVASLFRLGIFRASASPEAEDEGILAADAKMIPDDAQWQVLGQQFDRLSTTTDRAAEIVARYEAVLKEHDPDLVTRPAARFCRFPVLVDQPDVWTDYFQRHGIELGRWFDAPVSPRPRHQAVYHFSSSSCPNGSLLGQHMINLPVNTRLSDVDVDRLCRLIALLLDTDPRAKLLERQPEVDSHASQPSE